MFHLDTSHHLGCPGTVVVSNKSTYLREVGLTAHTHTFKKRIKNEIDLREYGFLGGNYSSRTVNCSMTHIFQNGSGGLGLRSDMPLLFASAPEISVHDATSAQLAPVT